MHRRRFLTLLPLGAALLARPWSFLAGRSPRTVCLRFHAAGVRFQGIDVERLARGLPVELRQGRFGDETSFAIHAADQRLGFVPRRLVGQVAGRQIRAGFLSDVRPHAVPWKQLEITLELAAPIPV